MQDMNYKFALVIFDGDMEYLAVNGEFIIAQRETTSKTGEWNYASAALRIEGYLGKPEFKPVMLSTAAKADACDFAWKNGILPIQEEKQRVVAPAIRHAQEALDKSAPARDMCANCKFWFQAETQRTNGTGFCNRYPPMPFIVGTIHEATKDRAAQYEFAKATPVTKAIHWCGEHQLKDKYNG